MNRKPGPVARAGAAATALILLSATVASAHTPVSGAVRKYTQDKVDRRPDPRQSAAAHGEHARRLIADRPSGLLDGRGGNVRQFVARMAIAFVVGALLIVPSASISRAAAASCTAVTHGTLAEVVASPGLILVADVIAIRELGTPEVDRFAVEQIIRPEVPDQGSISARECSLCRPTSAGRGSARAIGSSRSSRLRTRSSPNDRLPGESALVTGGSRARART